MFIDHLERLLLLSSRLKGHLFRATAIAMAIISTVETFGGWRSAGDLIGSICLSYLLWHAGTLALAIRSMTREELRKRSEVGMLLPIQHRNICLQATHALRSRRRFRRRANVSDPDS